MRITKQRRADAAARLCPSCGMCCNGVLFGDVELQKTDDVKRLTDLGLKLFRKGRKKCFAQPCSCFDGRLCQIYEDRPDRCRTFECKLLKNLQAGEISESAAFKATTRAKKAVDAIRNLLRKLGNADDGAPLNLRCSAVLSEPIDLSVDDDVGEQRRELMLAVDRLARILEKDFLV